MKPFSLLRRLLELCAIRVKARILVLSQPKQTFFVGGKDMLWSSILKFVRIFLEAEIELSALNPGEVLPLEDVKIRFNREDYILHTSVEKVGIKQPGS